MRRESMRTTAKPLAALALVVVMALQVGCNGDPSTAVAGEQETASDSDLVIQQTLIDFAEATTSAQLEVSNIGSADLPYELTIDYGDEPENWLTISPITGEFIAGGSVAFTLTADRSMLPAGVWSAEVSIASGAIRRTVIVSIAVVAVAASFGTHDFGAAADPFSFQVWNAGGGTLQYQVADAPPWLTVEGATGTSADRTDRKTVTLTPDRTNLAPGAYSGQVVIVPVAAPGGSSVTIDVHMTVLPPGVPALTIQASATGGDAPLTVDFTAMDGGSPATDLPAGSTLNWDFGDDTDVAHGNPVSHTFTRGGDFLVALTLTLAGGLGTVGCQQTTIHVTAAPPKDGALIVTPTDYAVFAGSQGGPFGPASVTYTLTNNGGQAIAWTAGTAQAWVGLSKTSGSLDAGASDTVSVAIDSAGNSLDIGNYSGRVTFTNTTNHAGDTSRNVSLTVSPVNHTPTAQPDSYTTNEDTPLTVSAPGVLGNDSDPDSDPLTTVLVALPSHGTLTLNANGSFTYTPAANYNGSDSFTYKASDGTLSSATATVSITINPVNDAPTFTAPAGQTMAVNSAIQVTMAGVSPGPADESGQTVTFTATSSNQAVVPNANLVFAGSQLTITSIATGPATITVTARDSGGTANGGVDTTTRTFGVTAFNGVPISGTISLVDTVGARPKFGQHGLVFTGTGGSAGQDFTTLTDVDGHYVQPVPSGWTGTITARDPSRMIFLDPITKSGYDQNGNDVSVRTISTPVTGAGLSGQDIVAWTVPIGIPGPDFGIRESHWMYKGQTYDYGNGPEPYHDAGNGPYTHYVDNTNPNATDAGNPYGTPAKPRKTIPSDVGLTPGSVVEVHGTYPSTQIRFVSNGTSSQPVFLRGASGANKPAVTCEIIFKGSYVIVENLYMQNGLGLRLHNASTLHHAAARFNECAGDGTMSGPRVGFNVFGALADVFHDIVIYNNHLHDNGDNSPSAPEGDWHGAGVGGYVEDLWVLDNRFHHYNGDGVQVNAGSSFSTHRVYIGRNQLYSSRENSVDIKQCQDIIVSENNMYGTVPCSSDPGCVCVVHYTPVRVWFLNNEIHDGQFGINCTAADGLNLLGNVIYDIREMSPNTYSESSIWRGGLGIRSYSSTAVNISNNTIYDCVTGIGLDCSLDGAQVTNNIIAGLTVGLNGLGYHLTVSGSLEANSTVTNDLFFQADASPRIYWDGSFYYSVPTFSASTGKGAGCLQQDPQFVDSVNEDFHLQSGSPAIDSGTPCTVYQTFSDLYGITIGFDMDAIARPVGSGWDIGAYER